jgi:hypothetical protein
VPAPGRQTFRFSDLIFGSPAPHVDATQIVQLQWQFAVPLPGVPCQTTLTLDDILFVTGS